MTNCTGMRCPMQAGYRVDECDHKDCPWRTEQMTNADRIRSMTEEELAELMLDGCRGSKCDDQSQNEWGSVNCFQCRVTWLRQSAEGE